MSLPRRISAIRRAASVGAFVVASAPLVAAAQASGSGISAGAEAIHQEVVLRATPGRVYAALTEAAQFDGRRARPSTWRTDGRGTTSIRWPST
jgi:hypothetical protein